MSFGAASAGPRVRRMETSCTVTGPNARPIGMVAAMTGGPTLPDPDSGEVGCAGLPAGGAVPSSTRPRELE